MKKYEAPTIEFYVFETPESIMNSECRTLECTAYGICVTDGTSCYADGICIGDGCTAFVSGL